ncbi:response regulator transcription factor [Paraflavisolibacter sp. H34]|uniref:response regulator transcription factor n=1 Tax=Huijunlia imazamoxiresistens TaxID=3127457 RepID=UPI003016BD2C
MKNLEPEVLKVVIADDHALFRAGVRTALSGRKDIQLIAEAENGMQLLQLLKDIKPDVILLDIQMPIMDGLTALPEIRKIYPDMIVIMLSMVSDYSMVSKMMEVGANSYLTKESDPEVIYQAIKSCYEGEFFFTDLTNRALLSGLRNKKRPEPPTPEVFLNDKEVMILKLICEERSTKEIADLVDLSPRTVEAIRDKLKIKTGTKSLAGLVMFAVKAGLVEHA